MRAGELIDYSKFNFWQRMKICSRIMLGKKLRVFRLDYQAKDEND